MISGNLIFILPVVLYVIFSGFSYSNGQLNSKLHQYHYVCPKKFANIGQRCYYFSNTTASWFQSHFTCKHLNSTLASIVERFDQRQLEKFLFKNLTRSTASASANFDTFWVGGFKDWRRKKWIYPDGSTLIYPARNEIDLSDIDEWTCLVIDRYRRRWSAKNCMDTLPFICESKVLASVLLEVDKPPVKRNITIDDCISSFEELTKKQKKKCLKLLNGGNNHKNGQIYNEPAAVIQAPKPTYIDGPSTNFKSVSHICPQDWMSIGNQCYLFSKKKATWLDAHFKCNQLNSKLAVVRSKIQDQKLRIFLNGFTEKQERWIGGRYNAKTKIWVWALNGKRLKYDGFINALQGNVTSTSSSRSLDWEAIIMDPEYSYRWNSRNELEKHLYICQVKGRTVKRLSYPKRPSATIEINSSRNKKSSNNKLFENSRSKRGRKRRNRPTRGCISDVC